MRFGLQTYGRLSGAEWAAFAKHVERAGFDVLLVPDHFRLGLSPFGALASAAAVTRSLRIGTYVLSNDFRHPLVTAREAATLDLVSGGRFELGIGAGWFAEEYEQVGIAYDRPAVRMERLNEAITIISEYFTSEVVEFRGHHYQIRAAEVSPRPVQQPRPPILMGGGTTEMLRLAAERADIVSVTAATRGGKLVSPAGTLNTEAVVRKLDAVSSHRSAGTEINLYVQHVARTVDAAKTAHELSAEYGLSEIDVHTSPQLLVGTVDEMAAKLASLRRDWGITYVTVREDVMDEFIPVMAAVR